MRSPVAQLAAAILTLAVVTLVCFHSLARHPSDVLVGPQRGGGNDLTSYFIPVHSFPRQCMADFGQWPFWNPYRSCGVPHLGNPQSALFYPPNWLCWWWDPTHVLSWSLVAHHLFAGIGCYLLCRRYGFGWLASVTGGSIFLAAPYLIAQTGEGHYAQICAVAWMPWAFLAYEGVRSDNRASFALLAVALAMSFFAGHAQEAYYLVLILTAWMLVDSIQRWRAGQRAGFSRLLLRWILLALVTAGLVAVDLIPILVYGQQMVRSHGLSAADAGAISLGFPNLLQLINPFALGGPDSYAGRDKFFWESLCSFGIAPLTLMLVGVSTSWRRHPVPRLAWTWLVAIGFAFGAGSPVFHFLVALVPGMSLFRAPSRVLFFCSLATAVLAGAGVDSLLAVPRTWFDRMKKRSLRTLVAAAIVCIVLIALGKFGPWSEQGSDRRSSVQTPESGTASAAPADAPDRLSSREVLAIGLRRTLGSRTPWAWLLGGIAVVFVAVRWPSMATPSMLGMLALCVIQLGVYSNKMVRTKHVSEVPWPESVAHRLRRETGFFRTLSPQEVLSDKTAWQYHLSKVQGYEPIPLSRTVKLFQALTGKEDPTSQLTGSSAADPEKLRPNLLDLMNVRFIVLGPTPSRRPTELGWRLTVREWPEMVPNGMATDLPTPLYENPHVLPRAFVIGRTRVLAHGQDPVQALAELRPREEVLMDAEFLPAGPRAEFAAASIVEYTPNRVVIETALSSPGYLVLSDSWYPGWTATDNGQPIQVLPANVAFRAVPLGAGQHRVIFHFAAVWLITAATVSGTTWLVLVAITALGYWFDGRRVAKR